jgi:hypothetical protein
MVLCKGSGGQVPPALKAPAVSGSCTFCSPLCSRCPKEHIDIESLLHRPKIIARVANTNVSDVVASLKRTLPCRDLVYDINVSDLPAT